MVLLKNVWLKGLSLKQNQRKPCPAVHRAWVYQYIKVLSNTYHIIHFYFIQPFDVMYYLTIYLSSIINCIVPIAYRLLPVTFSTVFRFVIFVLPAEAGC